MNPLRNFVNAPGEPREVVIPADMAGAAFRAPDRPELLEALALEEARFVWLALARASADDAPDAVRHPAVCDAAVRLLAIQGELTDPHPLRPRPAGIDEARLSVALGGMIALRVGCARASEYQHARALQAMCLPLAEIAAQLLAALGDLFGRAVAADATGARPS